MRPLVGLLVMFGTQYIPVPGWYPAWSGREPLRFCVTPQVEPYRLEVEVAFRRWSELTALPQLEVSDCELHRTIAFRMAALPAPMLGMAMYPPPLVREPWAGDVFLNETVNWNRSREWLLPTIMHETAHAVGLPESFDPADVSYPQIIPSKLFPSASERRRMRCLYEGFCI